MTELSRDLNRLILELAPRHIARAQAPSTFAELMRSPDLVVWDGASDATIYGDARVNHAFRAWHDACHIAGGFEFTLAGEMLACEMQCRQVLQRYPRVHGRILAMIRAEVIGQAEHFAATGLFPEDQIAFIQTLLGR